MNTKTIGFTLVSLVITANALAWNTSYECISNDAKKAKATVSFLDPEILRMREGGAVPDRYYRVTDTSDELVEAMILGFKSGATAHLTPVLKGAMNVTMTQIDSNSVMASVKLGKVVQTYSCK